MIFFCTVLKHDKHKQDLGPIKCETTIKKKKPILYNIICNNYKFYTFMKTNK